VAAVDAALAQEVAVVPPPLAEQAQNPELVVRTGGGGLRPSLRCPRRGLAQHDGAQAGAVDDGGVLLHLVAAEEGVGAVAVGGPQVEVSLETVGHAVGGGPLELAGARGAFAQDGGVGAAGSGARLVAVPQLRQGFLKTECYFNGASRNECRELSVPCGVNNLPGFSFYKIFLKLSVARVFVYVLPRTLKLQMRAQSFQQA
jgi:hypothetical protein